MSATITTTHGQTVTVVPGRTVLEYRNGFLNAASVFASTHARDTYVARKKIENRDYTTVNCQYSVR